MHIVMLHTLLLGILIGWGVAIPVGPLNIEIIRRNLACGLRYGLAVALGAMTTDITYIILLVIGGLVILQHATILKIVGICGSVVLFWFGWQAIIAKKLSINNKAKPTTVWHSFIIGYLMALFSPYTILFWASMSSQVIAVSQHFPHAVYFMTTGIIIGILSFQLALNMVLHITRHRISGRAMQWMNVLGGLILIGFSIYGLLHALV